MSAELALFPLQTVLFPDGLLRLKVFEARYLDLMADCLRDRRPFGVVALQSGAEAGAGGVAFESVGTQAELLSADSDRPGILRVRCRGNSRFRVAASRQQAGGLWLARTRELDDDEPLAPSPPLADAVRALATTIATLEATGDPPFLPPYRFEEAGWVANRWCEILPISQAAKQKLMALSDPLVRLQLVDEFLRNKGVIK